MPAKAFTQDDIDTIRRDFGVALWDIAEGHTDEWLAHWTDDARLMPPDAPDVVGHESLRTWIGDRQKVKWFDIVDAEVDGSGDLAILVSHFVRVLDAPEGGETKQNGRQMLKFRRQPDGRWLIATAIFNAERRPD